MEMVPTPSCRTMDRPAILASEQASGSEIPEARARARLAATASPAPVTS